MRGRSNRRKLVWATSVNQVALGAGPTFNNLDLLANLRVAGASVLGATVVRTRGVFQPDNTGRAVSAQLDWGILVGRLTDIGGVVDLADDVGQDWAFTRNQWCVSSGGVIGQEFYDIDLRSKRKIQELDQTWLLCLKNRAGAAMTVRYFFRTLVALP